MATSAKKENGTITEVEVYSEKGGDFVLENPFENEFQTQKEYTLEDSRIILNMDAGETALIIKH